MAERKRSPGEGKKGRKPGKKKRKRTRENEMSKNKEVKTNAMRMLEKHKISYTTLTYECDEFVDALKIADQLGLPYDLMYRPW